MKRSAKAHEPTYRTRGGQTTVTCRCAELSPVTSNRRDVVERAFEQHVAKAERAARRAR